MSPFVIYTAIFSACVVVLFLTRIYRFVAGGKKKIHSPFDPLLYIFLGVIVFAATLQVIASFVAINTATTAITRYLAIGYLIYSIIRGIYQSLTKKKQVATDQKVTLAATPVSLFKIFRSWLFSFLFGGGLYLLDLGLNNADFWTPLAIAFILGLLCFFASYLIPLDLAEKKILKEKGFVLAELKKYVAAVKTLTLDINPSYTFVEDHSIWEKVEKNAPLFTGPFGIKKESLTNIDEQRVKEVLFQEGLLPVGTALMFSGPDGPATVECYRDTLTIRSKNWQEKIVTGFNPDYPLAILYLEF